MLLTECNDLLKNLKIANLGWQKGIRDTYGTSYTQNAEQAITSCLAYADKVFQDPINHIQHFLLRWMPGSIAVIGNQYMPHLLPSDHTKVFTQLKTSKRIMQVGGGRGKGLLVLSLQPLTGVSEEEVNHSDPTVLVKSLSQVMKNMTLDIKALKCKLSDKDVEIASLNDTIQILHRHINHQTQSSWL